MIVAKCDSCETVYGDRELALIDDLWLRVDPGSEFPAGQCPDDQCGALCYLVKYPRAIVIEVEGGCVTDVHNLPDGWQYIIDDHDLAGPDAQ